MNDERSLLMARTGALTTIASTTTSSSDDSGPDMTIWIGDCFEVRIENEEYSFEEAALSRVHDAIAGYVEITAWDSANKILKATLYGKNDNERGWLSTSLQLHYISGTNLDFLCWCQVTVDSDNYGFTVRIKGKLKEGVLVSATFKTVGGYYARTN